MAVKSQPADKRVMEALGVAIAVAVARKSLIEAVLEEVAQRYPNFKQDSVDVLVASPKIWQRSQNCYLHLCCCHRAAFRLDPAHFE